MSAVHEALVAVRDVASTIALGMAAERRHVEEQTREEEDDE